MKAERMYREAEGKTLNPYVGCLFDCKYCYPSFRRQAKRRKKACMSCYNYIPHSHMERLNKAPPRTHEGEFVFLVDMGDPSFIPATDFMRILDYCKKYSDRTFLLQSKDPQYFEDFDFPENVVLGTTLETNDDGLCVTISKAPPPSKRIAGMMRLLEKKLREMITVEPILKFDLAALSSMILSVRPWRVYVGYDSHPNENRLPEPSLAEADALVSALNSAGIDVRWKLRRKAWWE